MKRLNILLFLTITLLTTFNLASAYEVKHTLRNLVSTYPLIINGQVSDVFSKIDQWMNKAEKWNRVQEFRSAYKKFKKDGLSNYAAYKRATIEGRDLADFAMAGQWMWFLRNTSPFLNAAMQ